MGAGVAKSIAGEFGDGSHAGKAKPSEGSAIAEHDGC